MARLGVIVNPVAGLGGRVGLKGSDGPETLRLARERGAQPEALSRTIDALRALKRLRPHTEVLAYAGEMGADACHGAGIKAVVTGSVRCGRTTAADTKTALRQFISDGVDLVMFTGGDGTARDIHAVAGERQPVIGVPAGVKIHSAVFAVTPRSAGRVAAEFLEKPSMPCRSAEVMDIDEIAFREGRVAARLYGTLSVPDGGVHLQGTKAGGFQTEQSLLRQIAQTVTDTMALSERVFIIGPGTTTRAVMDRLGLENTLLGVDVVRKNRLVAKDADENRILDLIAGKPATIVVTVIGGQGHLFGRGNQQISPAVIRSAGKENIIIVATQEKLLSLGGNHLLVDTGDVALDRELEGYVRVVTGLNTTSMYRIGLT